MRAFLGSLRSLVLGDTWTIPIGVGLALVASLGLREVLPQDTWEHAGGFVLAALVLATAALSLKSG
jgi:hypothetical protein